MKRLLLALMILVIILLAACARQYPTPEPTPTASVTPPRAGLLATQRTGFLLDRVRNTGAYANFAAQGVTMVVESFDATLVYGTVNDWRAMFQAAQNAGLEIVAIPSDWKNPATRANCNWESPFPVTAEGDISRITAFLDVAVQYNSFSGVMAHHETSWPTCPASLQEVAGITKQIRAYLEAKNRTDVKIWDYIGGTAFLSDALTPPGQIDNLADVMVIWRHCFGNAEGRCADTVGMLQQARAKLTAAGSQAQLVYLAQTFTTISPWNVKPSLSELQTLSEQVIASGLVDVYGLYTYNASWWNDLADWTDLQPIIPYVGELLSGAPLPSATPAPPTPTAQATNTRTPAPDTATPQPGAFTFISLGDAQGLPATFSKTITQAKTLNPAFYIFNGDLENDGVTAAEMATMTAPLAGLQFKAVRGNHDNHVSGSAALWQSYYQLNYNFEHGNSVFIGVDVPGAIQGMTTAQINQVDAQLTAAEGKGLTHAFLFFHGPAYCVESVHCSCTAKLDGSCTPAALVAMLNKHPIVSALFSGHEHILGWTHMDNTRIPALTGAFEQFLTSPSGGYTYNSYVYQNRLDYFYPAMGTSQGFGAVVVDGNTFTVNLYKVGTLAPVWSKTFIKGQPGPTNTPAPATLTNTPKPATATLTSTPKPPTPTSTPTSTPGCVVVEDGQYIVTICEK